MNIHTRQSLIPSSLLFCRIALAQQSQVAQQTGYAASRALVKFADTSGAVATAVPADAIQQNNIGVSRPVGGAGAFLLQSKSMATADLIASLKARPDVLVAEPDYILVGADNPASGPPDDPYYGYQIDTYPWGWEPALWGLGKISVPLAWGYSTGSSNTVMGILDTGVDYTHPDLSANMWSAPEALTITGLYGSGSPLTCPSGSHGFAGVTDQGGQVTLTCDPAEVQSPFYGHGTRVSGIAGAVGNNGIGIVGVNWTASIMGLRMAGNPNIINCPGGFCGYLSDALNAVEFAVQAKANYGVNVRVLSASWAWNNTFYGCGPVPNCTPATAPQVLLDEINRAANYDILFVAAAGNGIDDDGTGIDIDAVPTYPASLSPSAPSVLAVAATAPDDTLATFSSWSIASVQIAAPGTYIFSTLPGSSYGYPDQAHDSGTSFAAPFVSGAAALVLSRCPSLGAQGLKMTLINNADYDPYLNGFTATSGRLNVGYAVEMCACDVNGDGTVNVADYQWEVNEALGVIPAVNDLNCDGVVNVIDVQIVIDGALGVGCPASILLPSCSGAQQQTMSAASAGSLSVGTATAVATAASASATAKTRQATVPVALTNSKASIAALQFDLLYNKSALAVSASAGGPATAAGKTVYVNTNLAGGQRVIIAGLNRTLIGNGSVVSLAVQFAASAASGSYPLTIANIVATDASGNRISLQGASGSVATPLQ